MESNGTGDGTSGAGDVTAGTGDGPGEAGDVTDDNGDVRDDRDEAVEVGDPATTEDGPSSRVLDRSSPREESLATVAIVDYGVGNLRSVTRGLEHAGAAVEVTDDPDTFRAADGVVLPGVGAFREGVENAAPIRDALLAVAESEQPLFGICLGMQMLLTDSEEAETEGESAVEGLSVVPGTNVRFGDGLTVPHMGWNALSVERDHPIAAGVDGEYVYFVHSYYAVPDDPGAVVATADYGAAFPAIVASEDGTVFGTQFHPEKSGTVGLRILRNFVEYCADR